MDRLPVVLVFEIARYFPLTLPSLEIVNKTLHYRITHDPSYIQTLLEDLFEHSEVRSLSYADCRQLLKIEPKVYHLRDNDSYNFITVYDARIGEFSSIVRPLYYRFKHGDAWCFLDA